MGVVLPDFDKITCIIMKQSDGISGHEKSVLNYIPIHTSIILEDHLWRKQKSRCCVYF